MSFVTAQPEGTGTEIETPHVRPVTIGGWGTQSPARKEWRRALPSGSPKAREGHARVRAEQVGIGQDCSALVRGQRSGLGRWNVTWVVRNALCESIPETARCPIPHDYPGKRVRTVGHAF